MEDVEERRRRLAAMREEAASQVEDFNLGSLPSASSPAILCNPLEDSTDIASAEENGHRFDFYTDPLAGFSGSKRRRAGLGVLPLPQSSRRTPATDVRIMHPAHLQPPIPYPPPSASSLQPIEYQPPPLHPAFVHPHHPPQFHLQIPPLRYMNQWYNQASNEFFNRTSGPGRGRGQHRGLGGRYNDRHSPIDPAGRGNFSGRDYPSSSRGGRRGNSWSGGTPSGDSWRNRSRSEGRGSHGRGQRGGRIASAKEQPHMFFKRSMLEDPWQALVDTVVERT